MKSCISVLLTANSMVPGRQGFEDYEIMRIKVRHPDENAESKLTIHAEKLLQRVLDPYNRRIDAIEVRLEAAAGTAGRPVYRCTLTVKLLAEGSVQAEASDCGDILALYRAADKVNFLLEQRLRPAKKR